MTKTIDDGIVVYGNVAVELYRLVDCAENTRVEISKVHQGTEKEARHIISLLDAEEIEALPQKRHCLACNKLIDIKTGQKKRYCDGSRCRQAAFMLRKQVIETGEWINGIFRFSHKGQLKGGAIKPLGKDTYEVTYLDGQIVVSIADIDNSRECAECRGFTADRVVCQIDISDDAESLHLGRVATIMEGFVKVGEKRAQTK